MTRKPARHAAARKRAKGGVYPARLIAVLGAAAVVYAWALTPVLASLRGRQPVTPSRRDLSSVWRRRPPGTRCSPETSRAPNGSCRATPPGRRPCARRSRRSRSRSRRRRRANRVTAALPCPPCRRPQGRRACPDAPSHPAARRGLRPHHAQWRPARRTCVRSTRSRAAPCAGRREAFGRSQRSGRCG